MSNMDFEYFARRELQERAHAQRADDVTARHIHLALAEHYAARLRAITPVPEAADERISA